MNYGSRVLLLISVLLPVLISAQINEPAHSAKCHVPELVRPEGWQIPGLAKTSTQVSRTHYNPNDFEDVFVTILKSESRAASIIQLFCIPSSTGRLEFREQAVDVDKIWRFEKNGKVFAYRVDCSLVGIEGTQRDIPSRQLQLSFSMIPTARVVLRLCGMRTSTYRLG